MKHLKTFENNTRKKYKKYIVWDYSKNITIFEVINDNKNTVKIKRCKLFHDFNNGTNITEYKLSEKEEEIQFKNYRYIDKYLLYQSDNLEDCVEKIQILKIANKYNI